MIDDVLVFFREASLGILCVFALESVAVPAESKDLTEMVRIPAGPFLMGSNDGPEDERPQHKVDLSEFFIDRTKVTNGQFAAFLNAVGPRGPRGENYYDVDDNDSRAHRRDGRWRADAGHENH